MRKKKRNPFLSIFYFLFMLYVVLMISTKMGYNEGYIRKDTVLTKEMIEKFEQDVKDEKTVDVIDYLPEKENYANVFTKSANFISQKLGSIINSKKDSVWDFLKSLFLG